MIKNIKKSYAHIPYTLHHIMYVNKIAWKYFHRIYPLHDMDKVIIYILFPWIDPSRISRWHRSHSSHHNGKDIVQAICDWESARFTKPDKPLNARATCLKWYPQWKDTVLPILDCVGL